MSEKPVDEAKITSLFEALAGYPTAEAAGWTFIRCAHGREPWTRCDYCTDELTEPQAKTLSEVAENWPDQLPAFLASLPIGKNFGACPRCGEHPQNGACSCTPAPRRGA